MNKIKKYIEERPQGSFERFCQNEKATVKILQVNPNEELSPQYHHNQDEFWRVMDGTENIVIGNDTKTGKRGDEFFIPRENQPSNQNRRFFPYSSGNILR